MTTNRKEYMREYYAKRKQVLVNKSQQQVNSQNSTLNPPQQQVQTELNLVPTKSFNFQHSYKDWVQLLTFLILLIFVITNTSFLVNEQVRFYIMRGESFSYAIFISLLLEFAAILLAFFSVGRPILFIALIPTLIAIFLTIFLGIERSYSDEILRNKISGVLEEEISILKEQKNKLQDKGKDTEKILQKIQSKQEELRGKLYETHDNELWILAFIRGLAMIWNVIFSIILAKNIKSLKSNLL